MPSTRPEYIKAAGMARIPVPSDALSKCVSVSPSLQIKLVYFESIIYCRFKLLLCSSIVRSTLIYQDNLKKDKSPLF